MIATDCLFPIYVAANPRSRQGREIVAVLAKFSLSYKVRMRIELTSDIICLDFTGGQWRSAARRKEFEQNLLTVMASLGFVLLLPFYYSSIGDCYVYFRK